ncbi:hypothetical protein F5Y04DRAFT_292207 [Hypomontagnella monticulosa]|nr:hypothetical protein F5Y04DRAFT_292207 [Hypomontagnella monticulosa]
MSTLPQQVSMGDINQQHHEDVAAWKDERVDTWRYDILREKEHEVGGILAKLYMVGRSLYEAIIRNLDGEEALSKPSYRRLQSGFTNYIVWDDDYGASRGDLDAVLKSSERLRGFTVKQLISICVILQDVYSELPDMGDDDNLHSLCQDASRVTEEGSYIVHDCYDDLDSEGDESSDEGSETHKKPLECGINALLDETENLLDLGPRLEEPVPDYITKKRQPVATELPIPWDPIKCFAERILNKFPKCDSDIATALGKANWESMGRLCAAREKAPMRSDTPTPVDTIILKRNSEISANVSQDFDPNTVEIVSYQGEYPARAKLPQPPNHIEEGQLFSCVACGRRMKKHDRETWEPHLLADLQPWICIMISQHCEGSYFASRGEWANHLRNTHSAHIKWNDQPCPLCSHVIAGGGDATIAHVALHLEEISLAALPCYPRDGKGGDDDDDEEEEDEEETEGDEEETE